MRKTRDCSVDNKCRVDGGKEEGVDKIAPGARTITIMFSLQTTIWQT